MKYNEAIRLYKETANNLTSSADEWVEFLRQSASCYKYSFDDQLMIIAQRPNASAVASLDLWNKRYNRWVLKGIKGIGLLPEDKRKKQRLEHVFDIDDTNESFRGPSRPVYKWEVNENNHEAIADCIFVRIDGDNHYRNPGLSEAIRTLCELTIEDIDDVSEFVDSSHLNNTELGNLGDSEQTEIINRLALRSMQYIVLKRCGIDASSYIDTNDFNEITLINSEQALSGFGAIYTDHARDILRSIEKDVYRIRRQRIRNNNLTQTNSFSENIKEPALEQKEPHNDKSDEEINVEISIESREPPNNEMPGQPFEVVEDGKTFRIGYGNLGNGVTVWNSEVMINNDYQTIAHIDNDGHIDLRVDNLPYSIIEIIEDVRSTHVNNIYESNLYTKLDPSIQPVVTIGFTENMTLFKGQRLTLADADRLLNDIDTHIHMHRDDKDWDGGYYDKTDYQIDYTYKGELDSYKGRYDLGDGDGGLIKHIYINNHLSSQDSQYHEYILESKGQEALTATLDEEQRIENDLIPFFLKHIDITNAEQQAFHNISFGSEDVISIPGAFEGFPITEQLFKDMKALREIVGRGEEQEYVDEDYHREDSIKIEEADEVDKDDQEKVGKTIDDATDEPVKASPTIPIEFKVDNLPTGFSDKDIYSVLISGTSTTNGKYRVLDMYSSGEKQSKRIPFIKKEYGIGGNTFAFPDGTKGHVSYDGRGMRLEKYLDVDGKREELSYSLSWRKVDNLLNVLQSHEAYLTNEETSGYENYKEDLIAQEQRKDIRDKIYEMREVPPSDKRESLEERLSFFLGDLDHWAISCLKRANAERFESISIPDLKRDLENPANVERLCDYLAVLQWSTSDPVERGNAYYFRLELKELFPYHFEYEVGMALNVFDKKEIVYDIDTEYNEILTQDPEAPILLKKYTGYELDLALKNDPSSNNLKMYFTELPLKYEFTTRASPILTSIYSGKEYFDTDSMSIQYKIYGIDLEEGKVLVKDQKMDSIGYVLYKEESIKTAFEYLYQLSGEELDEAVKTELLENDVPDHLCKDLLSYLNNQELNDRIQNGESNHESSNHSTIDVTHVPLHEDERVPHGPNVGDIFNHENRTYEVESINELSNTVELKDLTSFDQGFPLFRKENIETVERWQEGSQVELISPQIDSQVFSLNQSVYASGKKARFKDNIEAIKLLKLITEQDREATNDERLILSKYVGWGGLAEAFEEGRAGWEDEYKSLKAILTDEEYASAGDSVLNAHFTDPRIIQSIYKTLEDMGVESGNILEPGCGTGNFLGSMPESLSDANVFGVEKDVITGRIAQLIYPHAEITIAGFEETNYPSNLFDVAIGNVPFGNYQVADPKYDKYHFLIHDYFIAKSIDLVRPGGIVAVITSKGTLDKQNPKTREYLASRAELLGAVRLPNDAFKGVGTDVTTDILFFQKLDRIREVSNVNWTNIYVNELNRNESYNQYFKENPEHVAGSLEVVSTQYGEDIACLPPAEGESLSVILEALADIGEQNRDIFDSIDSIVENIDEPKSIPASPDVRNFTYTMVGDDIYFRNNSTMREHVVSGKPRKRLVGMIALRNTVYDLLDAQVNNADTAVINSLQDRLNAEYDSFVKDNGRICSRGNKLAFSEDCTYPLLLSLEVNDSEGEYLKKADIFDKITIRTALAVDHVDSAIDALTLSITEKGIVDFDYMQSISDKNEQELIADLKGLIYKNPRNNMWESASEYLSGNIIQKIEEAKYSGALENVEALEKVKPQRIEAADISVAIGASWIEPVFYQEFLINLLEPSEWQREHIEVHYSKIAGSYTIKGKNTGARNIKVTQEYGTNRVDAYSLFEQILNQKTPRVVDYSYIEGEKISTVNEKETQLAIEKQKVIDEAFSEWIFDDPERRAYLTDRYNNLMNNFLPRTYDGSHLTFAGMNPDIVPMKHQRDAAAKMIYGGNTGVFHKVGAGKTLTSIMGTMECHRLGLSSKALYVVPNHLIVQWAQEYIRAYPASNVLIATKNDFTPNNRKAFSSRIATGDWDAVIIGHSQFSKIPVSEERQKNTITKELETITHALSDKDLPSKKELTKKKKSLEAKLKKLNDSSHKDNTVVFEQLGVDALVVDEAHLFKNLYTHTKMQNVAGIGQEESKRASDMLMKCTYIDEVSDGRGITFLTGTPISNAISELHVMMRYLMPNELKERDLLHFDNWATMFAKKTTALELSPQGSSFRMRTRLGRYINLPELSALFRHCADVKTEEDLDLPVPKVNRESIVIEPSQEQLDFMADIDSRADAVRAGLVSPVDDNFLTITNDGRKISQDIRLINPNAAVDADNTKTAVVARNVLDYYFSHDCSQLVFCDQGTPKNNQYNLYDDIKSHLIEGGIPDIEIAYIHEASTDAAKEALYKKVRNKDIKVLLGSTEKMGAGMNVQENLGALHHVDCPWRPSDLEQREGRIVRQGNKNDEVDIYTYVTENTLDGYSWQTVEIKQKYINQILRGDVSTRTVEDKDDSRLDYGTLKALATGNPMLIEQVELQVRVKELEMLKAAHKRQKYDMEDKLESQYPKALKHYTSLLSQIDEDILLYKSYQEKGEDTTILIGENKISLKNEDAGKLLLKARSEIPALSDVKHHKLGEYCGFNLMGKYSPDFSTKLVYFERNGRRYEDIKLGVSAMTAISAITGLSSELTNVKERIEKRIEETESNIKTANSIVGKDFPHEAELREKSSRLVEIDRLLIGVGEEDHEVIYQDITSDNDAYDQVFER